jgi:hypothetical protein
MTTKIYHTIIDRIYEYRIINFQYDCSSIDYNDHSIELWFEKGNEIRKLRFLAPCQLKIENGFPNSTSGMEILDISNRGMENINVMISDFEASQGSITFYAKDVIEIK